MASTSTTTSKHVFIIGPGFIGSAILDELLSEQKNSGKETYTITGLVRREAHAAAIRASGATAVFGDLDDQALITAQTVQAEIVLHTATADHLPSVEAVLEGVRQRASEGKSTIFIHTSGTSVLDDESHGETRGEKVYSDERREGVDSVPDSAPHREMDLAVVRAAKELGEKAKLAVMIPPLIYGYNPQHKRLSIQIPVLTRFALKHGYAPHVGAGKGVESNIHVFDLARGYVTLLHHMESTPAAKLLENPYYFCEGSGDQEPSWREVAAVIGESLHKAGRLDDPTPRRLEDGDERDLFGPVTAAVIGLNSRSRAVRLRALGWEAREKDWKRSFVEDELPVLLQEDVTEFAGYKGVVPK